MEVISVPSLPKFVKKKYIYSIYNENLWIKLDRY